MLRSLVKSSIVSLVLAAATLLGSGPQACAGKLSGPTGGSTATAFRPTRQQLQAAGNTLLAALKTIAQSHPIPGSVHISPDPVNHTVRIYYTTQLGEARVTTITLLPTGIVTTDNPVVVAVP